ncbi:MAG: type II toxin-antitoxin system HicB family antitoxin [Desulfobacteraceae bacterium]|nr:type II toxin-antitoxin system HicB family antitoxin [Desulfobacteraceae bacterium]
MKETMKTIDYYLNLPYKISVEPIKEEEGGGYLARIPQFGMSITGDGKTEKEAIDMLKEYKIIAFKRFLSEGKKIPEPKDEQSLDEFSGRILLRVPKELHQKIVKNAQANNVSQNQFLNYIITTGITNTSSFSEKHGELIYQTNYKLEQGFVTEKKDSTISTVITDDYNKAA